MATFHYSFTRETQQGARTGLEDTFLSRSHERETAFLIRDYRKIKFTFYLLFYSLTWLLCPCIYIAINQLQHFCSDDHAWKFQSTWFGPVTYARNTSKGLSLQQPMTRKLQEKIIRKRCLAERFSGENLPSWRHATTAKQGLLAALLFTSPREISALPALHIWSLCNTFLRWNC